MIINLQMQRTASPSTLHRRRSVRRTMSFTRHTLEMQATDTMVAIVAIFMTSQERCVQLPSHDGGEVPMNNYWKFEVVMPLFLFAMLPSASHANNWCNILSLESKPSEVQYFFGNSIEFGRYQMEPKVPPNAWRGLLPLRSSRAEVERLLGPPKGSVASSYSYETKEEKVRVLYSQGACEPSLEGQWNVPAETVLSITVFPQTIVLVNSLRLDNTIYKRSQEVHPENWAWYVSSDTGVMVHTLLKNGCEEVMSITYRPGAKDETLRCPRNGRTARKTP